MGIKDIIESGRRWFYSTPDRALDQAYQSALQVKAIEDEHFQGKKVSSRNGNHSTHVLAYFLKEVEKNLYNARVRLSEFRTTSAVIPIPSKARRALAKNNPYYGDFEDKQSVIIEKLKFIDQTLTRYETPEAKQSRALVTVNEPERSPGEAPMEENYLESGINPKQVETVSDKTGILPRSILRTFSRIKQEVDPKSYEAEEQVLNKFRQSRNKTAISIKFLLMLVIIPLLTHQLAKIAIMPMVREHFLQLNDAPIEQIFVNQDLEEEALVEIQQYKEKLELEKMIGVIPDLTEEKLEGALKEKAAEVFNHYRERSYDALGNVFSDLFSLVAFVWVILISRREIAVLKSFIDEIIYGLSDSAKAFLIILFTDIFVGYHSPHGWEIILEGITNHLGLPESRQFNFLFIATFPVILDTVLKYWIFRYLNRISPSAVATYRNMNE